ncbi:hypothetical protein [Candidatus Nitrosarchaeum limnium]|uniref:50S ribosomal protein L13e n=1 Tax=Candidatus Nitrosarchaeum limnium BG20 TaxID=859192 RepID=S2E4P6_9ARCH|nr:hypothetical protein [Candidatus Nitrosarchaeum limnium]EPA06180.1 hypothetical protein BG20_I0826 [Candidatus Nitrosarchaeum limnium BG20]
MNLNQLDQTFEKLLRVNSISDLYNFLKNEKTNRPYVRKRNQIGKIRIGRGWSKKELISAGLAVGRKRKFGQYDCRRTSCHDVNVEILKEIVDISEP